MRRTIWLAWIILILLMGLGACRNDPSAATATPNSVAVTPVVASGTAVSTLPTLATPTPSPTLTPTPPPVPPKTATVCLGRAPENLYLYGDQSLSAQALRHALYEMPYTTLGYAYQPQGLAKLPTLADGDVMLQTVTANLGERVVDVTGRVVTLVEGVTVVNSDGLTQTVSGPVAMSQLVVTFSFHPLVWSDGTPLSAEDSTFSFEVAASPDTPGNKVRVQHTAVYEVAGPLSVRWTGVPGFVTADYVPYVWTPLPRHQLGSMTAVSLLMAGETTQTPLSTGPFVVREWDEAGLVLQKNPYYYRAAEGLPHLEGLTVRFGSDAATLLDTGLGECDVVTQDVINFRHLPRLTELEGAGTLVSLVQPAAIYEHLDFSVNTYNEDLGLETRPDWFEDVRVRQAIAQCTDRQGMVAEIFYGRSTPMPAYIPATHPLYPADLTQWPYDPAAANALLDQAGYTDLDGDGIRQSPVTGQPFTIQLMTEDSSDVRRRAAELFQESVRACGLDVQLTFLSPDEWYDDGPLGPLFGRRFDLGMFAWLGGPQPACQLWLTENITGPEDEGFGGWGNVNPGGWSNPAFDAACRVALRSLPEMPEYVAQHQAALRLWAEELPILPLFSYIKITAVRPTMHGLQPDVTQPSEWWNVFAWDKD